MAKEFLKAEVYKLMLNKSINFITYLSPDEIEPSTTEITFNPHDEITIVRFITGGGYGFSAAIIYQIRIKGCDGSLQEFEEVHLYRNKTPIIEFIIKNKDVLFELISQIKK